MKSFILNVAVILGLLCSLYSPISKDAELQKADGWELTGQVGGPTQGIAVQGNYAYIGVGPRLVVVDISNPANPIQVGASAVLDDFVLGVAVSGTVAFVAAGGAGLQVVDIANPLAPSVIGAWHSIGMAEGVAVANGVAYVANGPYGLRVLDVSNPAVPVELAHAFEMNYVYDVTISGRYAYLAAAGAGLLIVDISNPAYPVEMGNYDTPGYAHAVAVSGGLAYMADQWGGLKVINVADPLHPSLFGALHTQGWVFDVTLAGSKAYIADAFNGLRVVNISDPAHPAEISGLEWASSNAIGIVTAGNQAYMADRKNGLRVINILDPAHPVQAGFFNRFDTARMVITDGDYAYLAAGFKGARILDISNPAQPVEVGAYEFSGFAEIIKVVGERLYVCTNYSSNFGGMGVHVVDISNPAQPRQISYYDWVGECRGIAVIGSLGYFADAGGLKIVDFSDLANPLLVGNTQEWAGSIQIQGNLAYVAQISFGWKIYNITDPGDIQTVVSVPEASGWTQDIKVVGSLAYVRVGDGIRIYDVSNPAGPVFLSSYPVSSGKSGLLEVVGDRLYVTKSERGFEVLDVSDPLNPVSSSQVDTLGYVQALTFNGEHLYIADNNGGMQVYSPSTILSDLSQSSPTPEPEMAPFDPLTLTLAYQVHPPLLPVPTPTRQFDSPDRLATNCIVTTTADSGPGSLRTCLQNQVNGDVITFSTTVFPPGNPATIFVLAELPFLDKGNVTIDASNAGVILNGSQMPPNHCCGIVIHSDGNVVQGLQVIHFPSIGIHLHGEYNLIGGSRLVGEGPVGQGNVFSGNHVEGIGLGKGNNIIKGNIIGLDASGTQPLGVQTGGISLRLQNNVIGSLTPGEGNVISANSVVGIEAYGETTIGNQIIGNYIGTDISGTTVLGNGQGGIIAWFGSSNTLIQGNVIVGTGYGDGSINLWDIGSDFNTIIGNKIGTDLSGTLPLPNKATAITVGWATYSRIGGTEPGEGNIIYGASGINVEGSLSAPNYVLGNTVGLNLPGETIPDYGVGLSLSGVQRSIAGGATHAEGNSFIMDQNPAIATSSDYQVILGNRIGITEDGSPPLRRAVVNMWIEGKHNLIQANQVAFASERGIWLPGQMNSLRRNSIYSNTLLGILLVEGGNSNLPAPSFSLDALGGSGTTCPGCTVELFLDAGNQGRFFFDSVIADSSGNFSFPSHCPVPYPYMNATVTDLQGNTSEFNAPHYSEPQLVPWDCSTARPAPTLESLDPTSLQPLFSTFLLTLTGTGFYTDSVVRWDGLALPTIFISSTQLQAVIPSYLLQDGGVVPLTVFTPAPGGGESAAVLFTILPPMMLYLPLLRR